jgi:predicted ABC-type ATPase
MPRCIIIAGPNGAGKTTFALKYMPVIGVRHFLNADMIASGLSPFAPETVAVEAGRLFLSEMETRIAAKEDFAFETTLAGKGYLRLIDRLQDLGWTVELYYLALPDPAMSKSRVAERVAHGGHHIPAADIERRYPRSLRNLLNDYSMKVDECRCYMNADFPPHRVFECFGEDVIVQEIDIYSSLKRIAGLE